VQNNAHLQFQIELKKSKKGNSKMSTEEYAMNKNILETIKNN